MPGHHHFLIFFPGSIAPFISFHPVLQAEESYFPLQRDRKIEKHTLNAQRCSAMSLLVFFFNCLIQQKYSLI